MAPSVVQVRGGLYLGEGDGAARIERHHQRQARRGTDGDDPMLGPRMHTRQLSFILQPVDAGHEFRVPVARRDTLGVVLDAGLGPGVVVHHGQVREPAFELQVLDRAEALDQAPKLPLQIVPADEVRVVLDHHRVVGGVGVDHAPGAVLTQRRGEAQRHEVEVDARVVAELHQHEGIATGQEARLVVDHRASSRLESVQSASMARRAACASVTETRWKR